MHKKRLFLSIISVLIAFWTFSITACADIGPKPSIIIKFEHIPDCGCFAAILTPYSGDAFSEDELYIQADLTDNSKSKVCKAFYNYWDEEGYKLQNPIGLICQEDDSFVIRSYWGIPRDFKILLYVEKDDRFMVSEPVSISQFSSKYTVDFSNTDNGFLIVAECYDKLIDMISWLIRLISTIVIEILVALLFGFARKKQLMSIAFINIITQIYLNIALSMSVSIMGETSFVINYLLSEIFVTIAEVIYYRISKNMWSSSALRTSVYAIVSNLISFRAGVFITNLV